MEEELNSLIVVVWFCVACVLSPLLTVPNYLLLITIQYQPVGSPKIKVAMPYQSGNAMGEGSANGSGLQTPDPE